MIEIDYFEYSSDANAQAAYVSNDPFTSQYPTQSDTYVKATSKNDTSFWAYYATDPTKSVIGASAGNAWLSVDGNPQRFHIDLGSAIAIKRFYYENYNPDAWSNGVKNFTFWGSNSATAFAELTYATDTDWTQLTTSQSTFDIHASNNNADPKYITVTNTTAYRYYAFKFADNWAGSGPMGFRRIELQIGSLQSYSESTIKTQGSYALKAVAAATDSLNKTLTHTFSSALDLSGVNTLKIDERATRTGANVKLGLRNVQDSYTKLLVHFDGATGDKPTLATTGQTITYVGTAQVSTAQKKFGTASLLLDGNSDYITIPDSDDWDYGSNPFTIDGWFRWSTDPGTGTIFLMGQYEDASNRLSLSLDSELLYFSTVKDGADLFQMRCAFNPAADTWYHIAIVRVNTDNAATGWRIFINGVSQTLTKNAGAWNATMDTLSGSLYIGAYLTPSAFFDGYIDELRISKGIARWTDDFSASLPVLAYGMIEFTPTIITEDEYETKTWDLSAVADADKNAIDKFIITPTNADAANTVYFDNFVEALMSAGLFFGINF